MKALIVEHERATPGGLVYDWLDSHNADVEELRIDVEDRDVDPSQYGIRAQPLAEHERATGTIVVSATHLSGQYLEDPNAYKWLLRHPRVAILNHTLHVFRVP